MRTGLMVWALVFVACGQGADQAGTSSSEARSLVAGGAQLLDVRSDSEWSMGHLEGALHVPIDELEGHLMELPRDRTIVVYCASGVRSARAAGILRSAGFEVRDLGAMSNWAP